MMWSTSAARRHRSQGCGHVLCGLGCVAGTGWLVSVADIGVLRATSVWYELYYRPSPAAPISRRIEGVGNGVCSWRCVAWTRWLVSVADIGRLWAECASFEFGLRPSCADRRHLSRGPPSRELCCLSYVVGAQWVGSAYWSLGAVDGVIAGDSFGDRPLACCSSPLISRASTKDCLRLEICWRCCGCGCGLRVGRRVRWIEFILIQYVGRTCCSSPLVSRASAMAAHESTRTASSARCGMGWRTTCEWGCVAGVNGGLELHYYTISIPSNYTTTSIPFYD